MTGQPLASTQPTAQAPAPAGWRLRLAGAPALLRSDGSECLLDRHGALMAARVVLDGPQPRSRLAAWLWPDAPASRARANLRQRLLRLRQQAGVEWVHGVRLLRLASDVVVLPWQPAAAGDLLAGVEAVGEPELAEWLAAQRRTVAVARSAECQAAWQSALSAERWDAALAAVAAWRALEPLAEAPCVALARVHYRRGDTTAAVAALQALEAMLKSEFGLAPGGEAQALRALLRQAQSAEHAAVPLALPSPIDRLWRPPELTGRDAEQAALLAAWSPHQVAWVTGEAGCGCTRLLQHVAGCLAGQGAMWLAAEPGDARVPGRMLQRLAAALGLATDGGGMATEAAAACAARVVAARPAGTTARAGGWVIDALHLADDDSLDHLPMLAAAWAVPLVLGSRPLATDARLRRLADTLAATRRLVTVVPRPWTAAQVALLLRQIGWPATEVAALVQPLCRHAGGHPRHVLDTLRALQHAQQAALPVPAESLHDLSQRLQRLAPGALALLRLLALAGADTAAEHLAAVLGRPLSALADDWQALAEAALLDDAGVPHGLAMAAVRAGLPAPVASALHRALAEQAERLVGAGTSAPTVSHGVTAGTVPLPSIAAAVAGSPARLAAHWLAGGKPRRALPWLLRAADQAHAALRPADEAEHLVRAVEVLAADDPAQAVELLLRLAPVQVEAHGIGAAAAPLAQALRLAGDDATRARVLLLDAEAQLNALRPGASARLAEQALAAAPPGTPQAAEAVLRLHKAWCLAGRAGDAEALWQRHAAWLRDDLMPSAEAVSDRGWVLDRLGRVREARDWHHRALDRALCEGRPVDEAVVLGNLAQSLVMSGEPVAAETMLDRLDACARRHDGLHSASDYSLASRATAAWLAGDPARALALFDRALDDAARQSAAAQAAIRVRRAALWSAIGQTARALADADAALQVDAVPEWTRVRARWLRAWHGAHPGGERRAALAAVVAAADGAQRALNGPLQLVLCVLLAQAGPDAALLALGQARALLRDARAGGHPGLRWAAHWTAAVAAQAAGQRLAAWRHLQACLARPAGQVALDVPEGVWWHGLWRVAKSLGDTAAALTAHRAGRDWVLVQQARLPEPFRPSFVAALPAHQALLAEPA